MHLTLWSENHGVAHFVPGTTNHFRLLEVSLSLTLENSGDQTRHCSSFFLQVSSTRDVSEEILNELEALRGRR